jgi:Outer membrane protein transport protein (OMPP1/FadL/TodX)
VRAFSLSFRASATLLVLFAVAGDARAAAGAAFAETSRVASLADAVTARPGDPGSMLLNPAGLADMKEAMVLGGGHFDYLSEWFQPTGNASQDMSRSFGGFYFAAATPLPGPKWARDIVVGLALDVPAQYLLHIDVPVRLDQPASPIYDGRPDRIASVLAVGYKIIPRIEVGAGIAVAPSLTEPAAVTYVAGRTPDVNGNVEVRLDSSLDLAAAPFLGLRITPFDWLGLSVVWRDIQASQATVPQTTTAGGINDSQQVSFFQMWDPASVVVGAYVAPLKRISFSVDVAWHKWSDFKTGFSGTLAPPYNLNDTVSIASGVEAHLGGGWTLRGGVGFEPTPIPTQSGLTNYLGGNTLILALGGGLDFRRTTLHLPFAIDAHVRVRADALESAQKDPSAVETPSTTIPGATQIDNMGYPGFRSQAFMLQGGLTATFFIGGGK